MMNGDAGVRAVSPQAQLMQMDARLNRAFQDAKLGMFSSSNSTLVDKEHLIVQSERASQETTQIYCGVWEGEY